MGGATDACTTGYAAVKADVGAAMVQQIGSIHERWRFKQSAVRSQPARIRALEYQNLDYLKGFLSVRTAVDGEVFGDASIDEYFLKFLVKYSIQNCKAFCGKHLSNTQQVYMFWNVMLSFRI